MDFGPPKRTVLNWYQYEVTLSIQLIGGFVIGVEAQAAESVRRYKEEKQTHIEDVPGEDLEHVIEVHDGIDSDTWHLPGIFGWYFPSLQGRSALLTLCGFFEHELNKLCLQYQAEKDFKLDLSDMRGSGVNRAIDYLEKIAGLDVQ